MKAGPILTHSPNKRALSVYLPGPVLGARAKWTVRRIMKKEGVGVKIIGGNLL